jgi:hypothetical protein
MRFLFVLAVLLLVGVASFGFYRGWFQLSTNSTNQRPSATITVDKDKIHADEEKATVKVEGLGRNVKERAGDLTAKVKQ